MSSQRPDETFAARLFACLTDDDRTNQLLSYLKILAPVEADGDEDDEFIDAGAEEYESIDDWLHSFTPCEWPNRTIVELDNLGDPGDVLRNNWALDLSDWLFEVPIDDRSRAREIAENYAERMDEIGMPLPSEFYDEGTLEERQEADIEMLEKEFVGFFQQWRENVVKSLEQQCEFRRSQFQAAYSAFAHALRGAVAFWRSPAPVETRSDSMEEIWRELHSMTPELGSSYQSLVLRAERAMSSLSQIHSELDQASLPLLTDELNQQSRDLERTTDANMA